MIKLPKVNTRLSLLCWGLVIGIGIGFSLGQNKNWGSLAEWVSGIGTSLAVIVALWQSKKDEEQKSPEILLNIYRHGIYPPKESDVKDSRYKILRRNSFYIGNYGKIPATNLYIELSIEKDKSSNSNKSNNEIKAWLNEHERLKHNKEIQEKVKELPLLNKHKVDFQDYLFDSEKEDIWFPKEYKELYFEIVKKVQTRRLLNGKDAIKNLNYNFPKFQYYFSYKYQNNSGKKIIEVVPKFKYYNDSKDGGKRKIEITFNINNSFEEK